MKTFTWRNCTCLPAHSIGLSWGGTTSYITFLLKFEYCINSIKFLSCPFRNAIPFAKLVMSPSSTHLYRLSLVLFLLLKVLQFFWQDNLLLTYQDASKSIWFIGNENQRQQQLVAGWPITRCRQIEGHPRALGMVSNWHHRETSSKEGSGSKNQSLLSNAKGSSASPGQGQQLTSQGNTL